MSFHRWSTCKMRGLLKSLTKHWGKGGAVNPNWLCLCAADSIH